MREGANVLVHAGLSAGKKPEDALDDEVRDEPAKAAGGYGAVDVCGFEEVGDEAVDGEAAFELFTEDFEAGESFGEGQEAGPEAHGH